MTAARQKAERLGRFAEEIAAIVLLLQGYRILARRFAASGGEIDIVARKSGVLVFVEVKMRQRLADAEQAVTPRGRQRIKAASAAYLARNERRMDVPMRFDIVAMSPKGLRHIRDAFR
ncbi:MAG: YraN family protein [Pseudomonadota bacterium]